MRMSTVLRRAFDKAVRRKPLAVAADAGPMLIQLWEGSVPSCAGTVREGTAAGTEREESKVGPNQRRVAKTPGSYILIYRYTAYIQVHRAEFPRKNLGARGEGIT